MANSRGKTRKQLDGEVNDILAARQRREARERSALPASRSSGIPSQAEYEHREFAEASQKLRSIEKAPLAERKEAAAAFLTAMREQPQIVAERIEWLLGGDYGFGPMQLAKRVLNSPRMNRSAALTHMIAAFEWSTPSAMAVAGWKTLTKGQQAALERAVQTAIKSAETED